MEARTKKDRQGFQTISTDYEEIKALSAKWKVQFRGGKRPNVKQSEISRFMIEEFWTRNPQVLSDYNPFKG